MSFILTSPSVSSFFFFLSATGIFFALKSITTIAIFRICTCGTSCVASAPALGRWPAPCTPTSAQTPPLTFPLTRVSPEVQVIARRFILGRDNLHESIKCSSSREVLDNMCVCKLGFLHRNIFLQPRHDGLLQFCHLLILLYKATRSKPFIFLTFGSQEGSEVSPHHRLPPSPSSEPPCFYSPSALQQNTQNMKSEKRSGMSGSRFVNVRPMCGRLSELRIFC